MFLCALAFALLFALIAGYRVLAESRKADAIFQAEKDALRRYERRYDADRLAASSEILRIRTRQLTQDEMYEIRKRFMEVKAGKVMVLPDDMEVTQICSFGNADPVKTYIDGKEVVPDPTPEDLERQGYQTLMNIRNIANGTENPDGRQHGQVLQ